MKTYRVLLQYVNAAGELKEFFPVGNHFRVCRNLGTDETMRKALADIASRWKIGNECEYGWITGVLLEII